MGNSNIRFLLARKEELRLFLPPPKTGLGYSAASNSKTSTAQEQAMPARLTQSLGETEQRGSLWWRDAVSQLSCHRASQLCLEKLSPGSNRTLSTSKPGISLSEDG